MGDAVLLKDEGTVSDDQTSSSTVSDDIKDNVIDPITKSDDKTTTASGDPNSSSSSSSKPSGLGLLLGSAMEEEATADIGPFTVGSDSWVKKPDGSFACVAGGYPGTVIWPGSSNKEALARLEAGLESYLADRPPPSTDVVASVDDDDNTTAEPRGPFPVGSDSWIKRPDGCYECTAGPSFDAASGKIVIGPGGSPDALKALDAGFEAFLLSLAGDTAPPTVSVTPPLKAVLDKDDDKTVADPDTVEEQVYGDPTATYHVIKTDYASTYKPDKLGTADGQSIPKGTVCREVEKNGKYVCLEYAIGGKKHTAWTKTSRLRGLEGDELADAKAAAEAGSGYVHIPAAADLIEDFAAGKKAKVLAKLPPGAVGRFRGVYRAQKSTSVTYALVTIQKDGAAIDGMVPLAALEGQTTISEARYTALREEKLAKLAGERGTYALDEITGAVDDRAEDGDDEIVAGRERARQQRDGPQHTVDIDLARAPKLYAPLLSAKLDDFSRGLYGAVQQTVSAAALARPGEAASGAVVDRATVAKLQETLLARYGASYYIEHYAEGVARYWQPLLDEKVKLLKRKKFVHRKKMEKTLRDEITWLLGGAAAIKGFAQQERAALGSRPATTATLAAPAAATPPAALGTLDEMLAGVAAHAEVLGNRSLSISAPAGEKGTLSKTIVIGTEAADEADLKQEAPIAGEDPGADWAREWDNVSSADASVPVGYLTVQVPDGLSELQPPVYGALKGGKLLQKTRLGERLAWTGTIAKPGGEPWAEIIVEDGVTGWIQARYTNGAGVSAQIKESADAQQRVQDQALDVSAKKGDKQAFAAPPAGLTARGYLVLRRADAAAKVYPDPLSGRSERTVSGAASMLLVETGPPDPGRAEVLVDGAPCYVDRADVRDASFVDLAMNADRISRAELLTIRKELATGAALKGEQKRKDAYYARLLQLAPGAEGDDQATTGATGSRHALADALASLGFASPFSGMSMGDALERIRIERGWEADDARKLAGAAGATVADASGPKLADAVRQGRAVLVRVDGDWGRVSAVGADGTISVTAGAKAHTLDASAIASAEALALSVAASVEGDTAALAALQADAALGAEEIEAAYKERLLAETTTAESDFYLSALAADPATAALAERLSAWIPSAADAARFIDSDPGKLRAVFATIIGEAEAPSLAVVSGAGLLPPGYPLGRRFVEVFAQSATTDTHKERLAELRGQLDQLLFHQATLVARTRPGMAGPFTEMVDALPGVAGAPVDSEKARDAFKNVLVNADEGAGIVFGPIIPYVNAVPLSVAYGGTLAAEMDAQITTAELQSLFSRISTFGDDDGRLMSGAPIFWAALAGTTSSVEQLWRAKRYCEAVGHPTGAAEIAMLMMEVEQRAGHARYGLAPSVAELDNLSLAPDDEGTGDVTYTFSTEGRDPSKLYYQVLSSTPEATPKGGGSPVKLTVGEFYTLVDATEDQAGEQTIEVQGSDGKSYIIVENREKTFKGSRYGGNDPIFDMTYASKRGDGKDETEGLLKRDKSYRSDAEVVLREKSMIEEYRDAKAPLLWHKGEPVIQTDDGAMKLDGTVIESKELASAYVSADKELRKYTVARRGGAWFLLGGRNPEELTDERQVWPISATALKTILTKQKEAQEALLERHSADLTDNQQALLKEADSFISNSALWSEYASFSAAGYTDGGDEKLNMDLVSRLQLMFKFFQHSGLASRGAKPIISGGIRDRTVAHKISTYYTIYSSGASANKEFMARLREIDGKDSDGNVWATPEDLATKTDQDIWDDLRSKYGTKQTDPAAEGYPSTDPDSRPNTFGSVSNHCGGEAMDINFPLVVPTYDPIIDLVGMKFGLYRPVIRKEDWHWERVGANVPYVGDML